MLLLLPVTTEWKESIYLIVTNHHQRVLKFHSVSKIIEQCEWSESECLHTCMVTGDLSCRSEGSNVAITQQRIRIFVHEMRQEQPIQKNHVNVDKKSPRPPPD
jgi:hypothetical protein